jgi:hypothetical protein
MDVKTLKATRAAKLHALDCLGTKLNRAEDEDPNDILLFESLKEELARLDTQIEKANAATAERARRAVPIYDPTRTSAATPRRPMNLRSFKDFTDARGSVVRADEQAYLCGKWLAGTIFGHGPILDWCRERGIKVKAQTESPNTAGLAVRWCRNSGRIQL